MSRASHRKRYLLLKSLPVVYPLLQGKVELTMGEEVHVLGKGDSIYLDSPPEHIWKNIGKTEVISFAVGIPPMSV